MRFSAPFILLVATVYTFAAPITIPREESVSDSRAHTYAKRADYGIDGLEDLSKRAIDSDSGITNPPPTPHALRRHLFPRASPPNQGNPPGGSRSQGNTSPNRGRSPNRPANPTPATNQGRPPAYIQVPPLRLAIPPGNGGAQHAAGGSPPPYSPPPRYTPPTNGSRRSPSTSSNASQQNSGVPRPYSPALPDSPTLPASPTLPGPSRSSHSS